MVIAITLLSFNAGAQFGVKAGLGISNWILKDRDVNRSQELVNTVFFSYGTGFGDDAKFYTVGGVIWLICFLQRRIFQVTKLNGLVSRLNVVRLTVTYQFGGLAVVCEVVVFNNYKFFLNKKI